MLAPADLTSIPEPMRTRLSTYLTRRTAFKSAYQSKAESFEAVRSDGKKRVIERAIVALIDAPGIEKRAAAFVAAAPIAYEWEGRHDGPQAEAAFAEDALKKDPSSPLAPFLYAFIAQRQRVVFETYDGEKNLEGMKAASKKYRAFMQRARGAADPIFGLLADDMDRQPFLYLKTDKHPGTFDPDA
jgi:hypothetical protein